MAGQATVEHDRRHHTRGRDHRHRGRSLGHADDRGHQPGDGDDGEARPGRKPRRELGQARLPERPAKRPARRDHEDDPTRLGDRLGDRAADGGHATTRAREHEDRSQGGERQRHVFLSHEPDCGERRRGKHRRCRLRDRFETDEHDRQENREQRRPERRQRSGGGRRRRFVRGGVLVAAARGLACSLRLQRPPPIGPAGVGIAGQSRDQAHDGADADHRRHVDIECVGHEERPGRRGHQRMGHRGPRHY